MQKAGGNVTQTLDVHAKVFCVAFDQPEHFNCETFLDQGLQKVCQKDLIGAWMKPRL
jgi:hypothetical protein